METVFEYCDKDVAFFSSDEKRWITKIRKLAKDHPDKVAILNQPEDNDGCIYAKLPSRSMKINIVSPRPLTDKQISTLKRWHENRAKNADKLDVSEQL